MIAFPMIYEPFGYRPATFLPKLFSQAQQPTAHMA